MVNITEDGKYFSVYDGAIHEAMIVLEGLSPLMGGDPERARKHFERAVELSQGRRAGPYVTMAECVCIPNQDREEFERLLGQALEIDPDEDPSARLVNLIVQKRAGILLERIDDFFL